MDVVVDLHIIKEKEKIYCHGGGLYSLSDSLISDILVKANIIFLFLRLENDLAILWKTLCIVW